MTSNCCILFVLAFCPWPFLGHWVIPCPVLCPKTDLYRHTSQSLGLLASFWLCLTNGRHQEKTQGRKKERSGQLAATLQALTCSLPVSSLSLSYWELSSRSAPLRWQPASAGSPPLHGSGLIKLQVHHSLPLFFGCRGDKGLPYLIVPGWLNVPVDPLTLSTIISSIFAKFFSVELSWTGHLFPVGTLTDTVSWGLHPLNLRI